MAGRPTATAPCGRRQPVWHVCVCQVTARRVLQQCSEAQRVQSPGPTADHPLSLPKHPPLVWPMPQQLFALQHSPPFTLSRRSLPPPQPHCISSSPNLFKSFGKTHTKKPARPWVGPHSAPASFALTVLANHHHHHHMFRSASAAAAQPNRPGGPLLPPSGASSPSLSVPYSPPIPFHLPALMPSTASANSV